MLRTLGAAGMSMNNEFEKKEILLLASKLEGTSIADSLVVSKRCSRLICTYMHYIFWAQIIRRLKEYNLYITQFGITFSFQASVTGSIGNLMAPEDANSWYCCSRGTIPPCQAPPWLESTKLQRQLDIRFWCSYNKYNCTRNLPTSIYCNPPS